MFKFILVLPFALALASCGDPDTPNQRILKIKESCEREYGKGAPAMECRIRLTAQALGEQDKARADRAERNSY